ncbi:MAG: MarR family transcriptional regulator [Saprospiraceae bacterium]|nr:MarR family transcriptional regulator [Saprospiraceae bacterium]MBK8668991.1 MarR family transcriptional regulator [Saprospiraceae bacterium]MBL0101924.1 MarR family transcriptional regulator [Saprospiraceae bacterium]
MEIEKVIQQTYFKDKYHKAVVNLYYTSNFFRDAHMPIFAQYDIQGQHYNVLRILRGKHPEPVSPGYIKEVILDKGRDLTRLIDKLVSLGLVDRYTCPENRRKMNIRLTDTGLDILAKVSDALTLKDTTLRHLTDEEYDQLSTLLDRMRG